MNAGPVRNVEICTEAPAPERCVIWMSLFEGAILVGLACGTLRSAVPVDRSDRLSVSRIRTVPNEITVFLRVISRSRNPGTGRRDRPAP